MKIDDSLRLKEMPAMLLQPVIENSIKHGYSYDHTDLNILVRVFQEKDYLVIKVENNGAPLSQPHAELMNNGVGLKNIDDRLRNLYKNNYFFAIRNKRDGTGVETIIKVPE